MAKPGANQPSDLPTSVRQRTILANLLLLFVLAIVITAITIQRQLSVEEHARFVDEQFRVNSLLSQVSESHLTIQQFVLPHKGHPLPDTEQFSRDYDALRQQIEEQIAILQADPFVIEHGELTHAHLTQYVATWHELDDLLRLELQQTYDLTQLALLSSYLSQMERLMGDLFEAVDSEINGAHWLWDQHARIVRNSLIGAMLLLLLLVAWTLYLFGQFIKEHQAIAAALQAGERRHRALLETIPDVVLRRTRAGIYTDFKPAKTFGDFLPSVDFIGKHVSEILPPEIAKLSTAAAERALESGEEQVYEYRMPKRLSGVIADFEARVIPSGEDEVQVIVRDITADKLESERLQQAQRLESLGILAGGIAHDFNNLLTSMMAQLSLAKAKLLRNQLPISQIDKAFIATERAADLTRQLLAYAGKGRFQLVALDLNQLIKDNRGMLETALPNRGELQLVLAEELPLIQADRGHIQQVLMNIAINAAEALRSEALRPEESAQPGQPILAASPRPLPLDGQQSDTSASAVSNTPYVRIVTAVEEITTEQVPLDIVGHDLRPGHYVLLRIQDNGTGMEPAIVKRIFDPFFSTKERGHGLGLAATLGIVRTYGGSIFVESQPGLGTTFTLLFPAIPDVAKESPRVSLKELVAKEEMDLARQTTDTSTVLVIDDETAIREVVVDILQAEGLRLFQAMNGEKGIAQVQHHPNEIDLVLLDMKMPGLSGAETLKILHEIEPTLKVILSSGYTDYEIGPYLGSTQAIDFLPKPYSVEQLIACVNRALALPKRQGTSPHLN